MAHGDVRRFIESHPHWTARRISEHLNCNLNAIYRYRKPTYHRTPPAVQRHAIRLLLTSKFTAQQVAERLGITRNRVLFTAYKAHIDLVELHKQRAVARQSALQQAMPRIQAYYDNGHPIRQTVQQFHHKHKALNSATHTLCTRTKSEAQRLRWKLVAPPIPGSVDPDHRQYHPHTKIKDYAEFARRAIYWYETRNHSILWVAHKLGVSSAAVCRILQKHHALRDHQTAALLYANRRK